jgi:hypothetical protein
MAVGIPMKTTYANGDVLAASDINDITGTINLIGYGAPYVAGKNGFINGGMDVWQRGTSISAAASTAPYTADRWQINLGANQASTISRQSVSDTTNLPTLQYCLRFQRNSGQTGTGAIYLTQSFETTNSIRFAGQTATLSFYARKGANYSPTSSTLTSYVYYGTGTDQNITGSYTGAVGLGGQNNTLTTTWQRFTMTVNIDKSATEIALLLAHTPTGTAGAADYYEITGVQLEQGTSATTYSRNTSTYALELAACQRYYIRYGGTNNYEAFAVGFNSSTTVGDVVATLPVELRVVPTAIEYSTLMVHSVVNQAITSMAFGASGGSNGKKTLRLLATVASGLTTGQGCQLMGDNSLSAYLAFSAEL